MAKWILLFTSISFFHRPTNFETKEYCHFQRSLLKGSQLTCHNAKQNFFHTFNTPLNRTHWLTCNNCCLEILNEYSFNVPSRNNISILDLSSSQIRVLKKFAFSKFFLLKILILQNNSVEIVDTMSFNGIKKLVQLDLSKNRLKILTNNLFSDLDNLDILNLNRNEIFYIQPEAFVGLHNLKYLYLNTNFLKRIESKTFRHLHSLKILYVENNQIEEIHSLAFYNLKNLIFLYMNNNSINYLVQYNFKPLTSLLDLQLRNNNLSEIQTSSFNGLTNLRSLYLGNNNLDLIQPYGLIGLDSLEILELLNNKFEYINYFDYFSHLGNLRYLFLKNNSITNFTLSFKYEVPNVLTVLDLSLNNLTRFNLRLFGQNLPNIKEISVYGNEWSCEFFISMLNFFNQIKVDVCFVENCNSTDPQMYIQNACVNQETTDEGDFEETSSDFSTDGSRRIFICVNVLLYCFFVNILFY